MLGPTSTFVLGSGFGPSGDLALFFTMGMVAAVNPCGFAMLPAYLSYFLGLDTEGDAAAGLGPELGGSVAQVARALRVALAVSAGFMTIFGVAGLAVRHSSLPIYEYTPWISIVIGGALLVLGVAMTLGFQLTVNLPKLNRGGRERSVSSMYLFGLSYAIASIGCTLPIFLSAVAGTMNRDSVADGLVVFALYGAGMALVLSALTVALALARTSLVTVLRSARAYVNTVAGVLVGVAGVYVTYYGWLELRTYSASRPGEVPSSPVTDMVSDWSAQITNWVDTTGVAGVTVRLALLVALLAGLVFGVRSLVARRQRPPRRDKVSAPVS